jgi:DNA-binding transcriptional LysR family regulator
LELTYLYYFKVIAEKENMSRAAETLHVSQPALSKTISKLESSLGVTLFERKKGRISLSPIGTDFYRQIARAFDCIDEGQRLIDAYKKSSSSTVTIGSPVSELLNTLILRYMQSQHEDSLQISQYLYTPEALQEQLLAGKLDFALTPMPLHDPEITQIKLMDEEILLAVGRSHPLAKEHFVRLEDCKDERFLVNDSSFDRRAVIDNCKVVGFTPNITLCSNEPRMIDEALQAGRGVSMVPANAFYEKYSENCPVVALRFSDVEVFRFISIVSRKDRTLIEQPKKLYNFAITYFEQYGKELQQFLEDYFPKADFGPRKSIGLNREENIGAPDPAIRDAE